MPIKRCHIAVITNTIPKDSMNRLTRAASNKGLEFDILNFSAISLTNFENSDFAKRLLNYDIVYYRTGLRDTCLELITSFCIKNNLPIINGVQKYPTAHRKIQQAIICAAHNIKHPNSILVSNSNYSELASILGPKFVCKPDVGSKGKNVILVDSEETFDQIKSLSDSTNKFIAQELITDASEYRVYTLGNKGITSYKKIPGGEDFRANLHAGGTMCETEPELFDALNDYAGNVAACFEADISGVDILVRDGEFITLELNFQPGWENLKEITSTSFSDETLSFIMSRARK